MDMLYEKALDTNHSAWLLLLEDCRLKSKKQLLHILFGMSADHQIFMLFVSAQ